MSDVTLWIAVLALAFLGSRRAATQPGSRWGFTSGAELILLGVAVAPGMLGLVDKRTLAGASPFAIVAIAWLGLLIGVQFGMVGTRRMRVRRLVLATVFAAAAGAIAAGIFWAVARPFWPLDQRQLLLCCLGVGAVSSETTRYAVAAVVAKARVRGVIAELMQDLAEGDDAVPIVALAFGLALLPSPLSATVSPVGITLATIGVGVAVGLVAAALLRVELRATETFSILLGTTLLCVGIAERYHLAGITVCFAQGVAIAMFSGRRRELGKMLARSEHAVLVPLLIVAGMHVDLGAERWIIGATLLAVVCRFLAKSLTGAAVRLVPAAAKAGPALVFGFLPAGALNMAFGLAFALRFEGPVGSIVLGASAISCIVGEALGPPAINRVLRRESGSDPPPDLVKEVAAP